MTLCAWMTCGCVLRDTFIHLRISLGMIQDGTVAEEWALHPLPYVRDGCFAESDCFIQPKE